MNARIKVEVEALFSTSRHAIVSQRYGPDQRYRHRLRMDKWKQTKIKITKLVQLGASKYKAYEWANTRKNYWHTANSWILSTTLSNDYLKQLGDPSLLAEYQRVRVKT